METMTKLQIIIFKVFAEFNPFYKIGDSLGIIRPMQFKLMNEYKMTDTEQYAKDIEQLITYGYFEISGEGFGNQNIILTEKGYNFLSCNGY